MDAVLFGVEALQQLGSAELVAFDSETTGLKAERGGLRLCQFAAEGLPAVVVDCWELDEEGWDVLRGFFATKRRWVAHNAVFDLTWLQEHDCYPEGEVFCTMLASRLLENGIPNVRNGLDVVCQRYLGREVDKTQQRSDWSVPVLSQEQLVYAAEDVKVLLPLFAHVNERLRKAALQRAWVLECRAMPAIAQMQRTGIPFSRSKLEQLKSFYVEEIDRLGAEFVKQLDEALPEAAKLPRLADGTYNLNAKASGSVRLGTKVQAGFNLNSPKQLIDKLGAVLGEVPKDATGKPSASRKALRTYAADHVVVQTYLAWKRAEKRRQMVVALLEHQDPDGRIRANYLQLGADTGRMSCREPNLQQVPRDKGFREAAEAPEGWCFVVADFGQMELRLAAAISGDRRMTEAFQRGEDLHDITAKALYPEVSDDPAVNKQRRQIAKSANFGLLYGSGAQGLREYAGSMGITMSLEEAQLIREAFHQTYSGIAKWQRDNAATADKTRADKWAEVRIPGSGMRRYLMGDMNRLTTRSNTPVQGAGAAVLKRALGKLWPLVRASGEDCARLSATVHDEVLVLVREGYEIEWCETLSDVMESAEAEWLGDIPPLAEAAYGPTWQAAK